MNKEKIIEEFCKISSIVVENLREVKTFNFETMKSENVDEFLISDCFCDKKKNLDNNTNRVDELVIDFIKRAIEDKICELDIKNRTFFEEK